MAKRYRSLRREQRLLGGKILFVDHFFPEMSKPPCSDRKLCDFIETRPGFGVQFWVHRGDAEDVMVNPESVPEGMTVSDMEAAARSLQRLGINVNPEFLKKDPELEAENPPIPTLTKVRRSTKMDLLAMIDRLGWDDIDVNANAVALRESVLEKVKSLMN